MTPWQHGPTVKFNLGAPSVDQGPTLQSWRVFCGWTSYQYSPTIGEKKVPYRWSKLTTLENKKVSSAALEMRYWDLLVYWKLGIEIFKGIMYWKRYWDLAWLLRGICFSACPSLCANFISCYNSLFLVYKQLWRAMNSWLMATQCAWSVGCVLQIPNAYNFGSSHWHTVLTTKGCAMCAHQSTLNMA